jgi:hypothetical protein
VIECSPPFNVHHQGIEAPGRGQPQWHGRPGPVQPETPGPLHFGAIIKAMNNRLTALLAAVAGFVGGFLSRYASPSAVYAQPPAIQQEVRARRFVLVDEAGAPRGAFGIETNGSVQIEVIDGKGRLWFSNYLINKFMTTYPSPPKVPTLLH